MPPSSTWNNFERRRFLRQTSARPLSAPVSLFEIVLLFMPCHAGSGSRNSGSRTAFFNLHSFSHYNTAVCLRPPPPAGESVQSADIRFRHTASSPQPDRRAQAEQKRRPIHLSLHRPPSLFTLSFSNFLRAVLSDIPADSGLVTSFVPDAADPISSIRTKGKRTPADLPAPPTA